MELEPETTDSQVRVVAETSDDDECGSEEDEEDFPCAQKKSQSSQAKSLPSFSFNIFPKFSLNLAIE